MEDLIANLAHRFQEHPHRHPDVTWSSVETALRNNPEGVASLAFLEATGGEPDVIKEADGSFLFVDCSKESPIGRRNLCYDLEAWNFRKANKPGGNVMSECEQHGIKLLDEADYRDLQALEPVDLKTSSWLLTPAAIRSRKGAIFGDCRYAHVFVYHNGADSYYSARGYRAKIWI
ncbi:MAG: DUF4256 domain-containing protein [Erysipelotrichaceae bacterium]